MATDIRILLGRRKRAVHKARQRRQIHLAAYSGLETYSSDVENGDKEICIRTLQPVAKAFEMSITDLLSPTGLLAFAVHIRIQNRPRTAGVSIQAAVLKHRGVPNRHLSGATLLSARSS